VLKRKIKQIFNLLDSDKDGLISSSAIDISKIATDVLEAFSPLLIEMEDSNETLDLRTFFMAS
jgi:Ca2+-binding EF-hand superfamily protein